VPSQLADPHLEGKEKEEEEEEEEEGTSRLVTTLDVIFFEYCPLVLYF